MTNRLWLPMRTLPRTHARISGGRAGPGPKSKSVGSGSAGGGGSILPSPYTTPSAICPYSSAAVRSGGLTGEAPRILQMAYSHHAFSSTCRILFRRRSSDVFGARERPSGAWHLNNPATACLPLNRHPQFEACYTTRKHDDPTREPCFSQFRPVF